MKNRLIFPCTYFEHKIVYTEVTKPTGIQYMILLLIKSSPTKTKYFKNQLSTLGIPESLQDIFFNEIERMINKGILTKKEELSIITDGRICDFAFTEMGAKIFENETIPTGQFNKLNTFIYFNHALNLYTFTENGGFKFIELPSDSAMLKDFSKFKVNVSAEDYFNLNKGKAFPLKTRGRKDSQVIKVDEEITEVNVENTKVMGASIQCDMSINGNNVEVKFNSNEVQHFFDQKYKAEWFNLSSKDSFKYDVDTSEHHDIAELEKYGTYKLLAPQDMSSLLLAKHKTVFSREACFKQSKCFVSPEALKKADPAIYAIYEKNDELYGLIVGTFKFNNSILGEVEIPLGAEFKVERELLLKVSKEYLRDKKEQGTLTDDEIIDVLNSTKDESSLAAFFNEKVENIWPKTISNFANLKEKIVNKPFVTEQYKNYLKNLYFEMLSKTNPQNVKNNLELTAHFIKELNIDQNEALKIYTKSLTDYGGLSGYNILTENGFDAEKVISYFNPIPEVLKGSKSKEPHVLSFMLYNTRMLSICEILNIKTLEDYIVDFDTLDRQKFRKEYKDLIRLKSDIGFFKYSNKELFTMFEDYENIFRKTSEYLNDLEHASVDIKRLKKSMVETQIVNKEFLPAAANLSAKLEDVLRRKYEGKGSGLDKLIKTAKGIESSAFILHEFRQMRNEFLHVDKIDVDHLTKKFNTWCEVIFALEDKHESKSSN